VGRMPGAEVCHGIRNAAVEARLERDPTFSTASGAGRIDLHPAPRIDLDGERVKAFFACSGCALAVNGSSAPGQEVRERKADPDELDGVAVMQFLADDEARQAGRGARQYKVPICDACFGAKRSPRRASSGLARRTLTTPPPNGPRRGWPARPSRVDGDSIGPGGQLLPWPAANGVGWI
jgi:hypothetical protein